MRAVALALVLAVVLGASALNLALGAFWLAALLAIWLTRRRVRAAAWLLLLFALGAGTAAVRHGWLAKPPPASYEKDELAWLRARLGVVAAPPPEAPAPAAALERGRLAALRAEELRDTTGELLRRAEAAVAASRDAARLRTRAPAEVAGVEEAARQLALTLTAPEFRDLEDRRARLVDWLVAVEERLRAATDPADVAAAARALEPAAMAPVSLRALREDLARAEVAVAALARAVAGVPVSYAATVVLDYQEPRGELIEEYWHRFEAPAALRIRRLDLRPLDRGGGGAEVSRTLAYAADGGPPGGFAGGPELALAEPGVGQVLIVDRRVRRVRPDRVATALRRVPFQRLELEGAPASTPAFGVTIALDRGHGAVLPLRVQGAAPRLEALALPPNALHYASRPGSVEAAGGRDRWRPTEPFAGPLRVELLPESRLVRNPWFLRLKDYLYAPNPAAALASLALAALTAILVGRRQTPPPADRPR